MPGRQLILQMTFFWNVAPSSLTEIDRRFRGAYFLHQVIAMMLAVVNASETSTSFCDTTGRNIPEGIIILVTVRN
jgi:hypothetical protein